MITFYAERKFTKDSLELNEVLERAGFVLNLVDTHTGEVKSLSEVDTSNLDHHDEEYFIQCYYDDGDKLPPTEIIVMILYDKNFIYLEVSTNNT